MVTRGVGILHQFVDIKQAKLSMAEDQTLALKDLLQCIDEFAFSGRIVRIRRTLIRVPPDRFSSCVPLRATALLKLMSGWRLLRADRMVRMAMINKVCMGSMCSRQKASILVTCSAGIITISWCGASVQCERVPGTVIRLFHFLADFFQDRRPKEMSIIRLRPACTPPARIQNLVCTEENFYIQVP